MKYTIEISDEGVRSTHDLLEREAEHDVRAGKWQSDEVKAEPESESGSQILSEYISYLIYQQT